MPGLIIYVQRNSILKLWCELNLTEKNVIVRRNPESRSWRIENYIQNLVEGNTLK